MKELIKLAAATILYKEIQKLAAKGMAPRSTSAGMSEGSGAGSLLGGMTARPSMSMPSMTSMAPSSTSTSTPGSSFNQNVRSAPVKPYTGESIRAATPSEMMNSQSVMGRPWYNPQVPSRWTGSGGYGEAVAKLLEPLSPGAGMNLDIGASRDPRRIV